MEENQLAEKTQNLIAIGAAVALNCIPCFEHLYERAITSGVTVAEINRAAEVAGMVKNGAHRAITSTVSELTGCSEPGCQAPGKAASCSCG